MNSNRAMLAHPKYYKYYCNPLRPSWGEPYRDIASRMSAALSSPAGGPWARGSRRVPPEPDRDADALRERSAARPRAEVTSLRVASITSFIFSGATLVGTSYAEPAADLVAIAKGYDAGGLAGGSAPLT